MKERCIDDVAIHYSFVSRNYRKDLSSCTTIFCFSKFDFAHDLVQALVNDIEEKWVRMLRFSSHLSVQGYDSSSANMSWRGFFRRDNKLFSPRGLPTEEAMTRKANAITGTTNFLVMFPPAQLQLLNSHMLPQYFFRWVRYVLDEVWKNFPQDGNLICFGLIPAKWKQAMGILKMPPFCLDRQYVLSRLISLTVLPTGLGSKTDHL